MRKAICFLLFSYLLTIAFYLYCQSGTTPYIILTKDSEKNSVSRVEVYVDGTSRGFTNEEGFLYIALPIKSDIKIKAEKKGFEPVIKEKIDVSELSEIVEFELRHIPPPTKPAEQPPETVVDRNGSKIENKTNNEKALKDTERDSRKKNLTDFLLPGIAILLAIMISILVLALFHINRLKKLSSSTAKIGRYRLLEKIKEGGMGIVYKAKDPASKLLVAVKIMKKKESQHSYLFKRFKKEGQIIAEINKDFPTAPVVKVLEFGNVESKTGRLYIVMEYLEGETLDKVIKKKKLTLRFILWITKRIAEALEAAHIKGIYHRDLSLDNVILIKTSRGEKDIRLIDFGIAKSEETLHQTSTQLWGKDFYMPPERKGLRDRGGPKSDIYSLGCILLLLLEGKSPHEYKTSINDLSYKNHDKPLFTSNVRGDLKDLVKRMLSDDRLSRPDIQEVIETLDRIIHDLDNKGDKE
jgi:tRNA A-37 threonylcarbamoyl transferase component Bud32